MIVILFQVKKDKRWKIIIEKRGIKGNMSV
jgi:hypothetical protein